MRSLPLSLLLLLTTPILAQEWQSYDNGRFRFSIDIPPGFAGQGVSHTGAGQEFIAEGKPIQLTVWGGELADGFDRELAQRNAWNLDAGWNTTYEATTPDWADWSASKGSRLAYQRLVVLCDGTSYAGFRAEYSVADRAEMDSAIEGMARSLKGNC